MSWLHPTPDEHQLYRQPRWGYYAVKGSGADVGAVIFVRKSVWVWLYRLIAFGELNPYVLDQHGAPVCFNKWRHAHQFIHGQARYNAEYGHVYTAKGTVDPDLAFTRQEDDAWYQTYWQAKPDRIWPPRYDQHFALESPTGRRQIVNHWVK